MARVELHASEPFRVGLDAFHRPWGGGPLAVSPGRQRATQNGSPRSQIVWKRKMRKNKLSLPKGGRGRVPPLVGQDPKPISTF